jgi:hypothetical protein
MVTRKEYRSRSGLFKVPSQHLPGKPEEKTKTISQDNQFRGRESNPRLPGYKAGVPNTQPRRSVPTFQLFFFFFFFFFLLQDLSNLPFSVDLHTATTFLSHLIFSSVKNM